MVRRGVVYIVAIVYSLRNLCDTDNSGKLNSEQFALAMYLMAERVRGREPPTKLPQHLIPPTKRRPAAPQLQPPASPLLASAFDHPPPSK